MRRAGGFTLVELMICIVIVGIVVVHLGALHLRNHARHRALHSSQRVEQQVRMLLRTLRGDLRAAARIELGADRLRVFGDSGASVLYLRREGLLHRKRLGAKGDDLGRDVLGRITRFEASWASAGALRVAAAFREEYADLAVNRDLDVVLAVEAPK